MSHPFRRGTLAMALCALQKFPAEVLETTKLDTVWTICKTREQAIAAVSG